MMSASNTSRWADTWQAECERAAFNAAALMRMARRFPNSAAILEIVRSAPRSPDEEQDPEASPFMRCARAARSHAQSYDEDLYRSVIDYFHELASMKPARRALLDASVAGVLTGMGMLGG
jgi:MoxR-like ATPase